MKIIAILIVAGLTAFGARAQNEPSKGSKHKHSEVKGTTVTGTSKKHKHSYHSSVDGVSTVPGKKWKKHKHDHSFHSTVDGVNQDPK